MTYFGNSFLYLLEVFGRDFFTEIDPSDLCGEGRVELYD